MDDVQKLIDITFSIGLTLVEHESFKNMPREEVAQWIAKQLRLCGFDTEPCGASWGVLKNYIPPSSICPDCGGEKPLKWPRCSDCAIKKDEE